MSRQEQQPNTDVYNNEEHETSQYHHGYQQNEEYIKPENPVIKSNVDDYYDIRKDANPGLYEDKKYEDFVNPWRTSTMTSSPFTSSLGNVIEQLPETKHKSATGLKRETISEKRKKLEAALGVDYSEEKSTSETVHVTVKSVGCFDSPFHGNDCDETVGSIIINGVEMSQNKQGFNFVLIDFKTGQMEQTVNFDTHGKAGEYEKLEEFLASLEMWKIVCVAVKDDAKNYFPDSALKSFTRLGATKITSEQIEYRSSYAFVGLTGPETARAQMDWTREENSRAGQGPSIISVTIKTGIEAFTAAGGKLKVKPKTPINVEQTSAEEEQQPNNLEESNANYDEAANIQNAPSPAYLMNENNYNDNNDRNDIWKYQRRHHRKRGRHSDHFNDESIDSDGATSKYDDRFNSETKERNEGAALPSRDASYEKLTTINENVYPTKVQNELIANNENKEIDRSGKNDGNSNINNDINNNFPNNNENNNNNNNNKNDDNAKQKNGKSTSIDPLKDDGNIQNRTLLVPETRSKAKILSIGMNTTNLPTNAETLKQKVLATKLRIDQLVSQIMSRNSTNSGTGNNNNNKAKDSLSTKANSMSVGVVANQSLAVNKTTTAITNNANPKRPIIIDFTKLKAAVTPNIALITPDIPSTKAEEIKSFSNTVNTNLNLDNSSRMGISSSLPYNSTNLVAPKYEPMKTLPSVTKPVVTPLNNLSVKYKTPLLPVLPRVSKSKKQAPLTDPVSNLLEAAKNIGLNTDLLTMNLVHNKHDDDVEHIVNTAFIRNFMKTVSNDSNDLAIHAEINANNNNAPPSAKELLSNTISDMNSTLRDNKYFKNIEEASLPKPLDMFGNRKSLPTEKINNPYENTGTPVPSSSMLSSLSENSNSPQNEARNSPANLIKPPMEESASEVKGSRNVGESHLASALSSLGIPDAGAIGIASLMASGLDQSGSNNKKDIALKLGLAAKLAKSIADLGGRGGASAAGIASLNELLKDGREVTASKIADQVGQALQRVGGAGAAVGYAALAAALKSIDGTPSAGALVGGFILALAEQGSAPGTAGLAALAAGLGGSGADALAGGIGVNLADSTTVEKTKNFLNPHTGGQNHPTITGTARASSLDAADSGVLPRPASGTAPLVTDTLIQHPSSISSELQYHPGNIETEYTGQGPIGSVSQGNFANVAKLLPNKFVNPEPVAVLSNGQYQGIHNVNSEHNKLNGETNVSPITSPIQTTGPLSSAVNAQTQNSSPLSPEIIQTFLSKLTESLKKIGTSAASSHESLPTSLQATSTGATEPDAALLATLPQQHVSVLPQQHIDRQVNLKEVLDSAVGHKEGVTLHEIIAELQHPQNNEAYAQVLENGLGTHISSELRPVCCGSTKDDVGKPLTSSIKQTSCRLSNSKNLKRCMTECNEKKEMFGRLVDLVSSEKKAVIKINGEDWSKDENGFNIVVLDFMSGEVEATENFDTVVDGGAARSMTNFIKSLQPGKVILAATKGQAGELMNKEAYNILRESGAKTLGTGHKLQADDKYVFMGYKGDDQKVPWNKENLNQPSTESTSLVQPIIVGPGAMRNICACLHHCNNDGDKKSASVAQPEISNFSSESAYADMGGMPVAEGSVGTKRMVYHENKIKPSKNILQTNLATEFNDEASGDELTDESKQNIKTPSSQITKFTVGENTEGQVDMVRDVPSKGDIEEENSRLPINHSKSSIKKHKLKTIKRLNEERVQHKLKMLQRKLEKIQRKIHSKKIRPELAENKKRKKSLKKINTMKNSTKLLLNDADIKHIQSDTIKVFSSNAKYPSHAKKTDDVSSSLKEAAISLVNHNFNDNLMSENENEKTEIKHEESKHEVLSPAAEETHSQPITTKVKEINVYEDIYSTIGNNLHSRKKSERPHPEENV